ncbi:MAG: cob(I)yrinic acid a,c-diamide adenosyltransferase [Candidatus Omnitrophica bacterium]|nr:cob(I)yrinic acid a,c-diamide adenosyltransferase [Candidatus Omnitrophota bacterium]
MKKPGLVQIYTGVGKGKTTAAVGLAARAAAQGLKICYVSFHKDFKRYAYGESKSLKKLGVKVCSFAKYHPHCSKVKKDTKTKDLPRQCLAGLNHVKELFEKDKQDMIILDEIIVCVRDGFLKEEDVLALIKEKPKNLELVLTGRGATKKMIQRADLVSFIKEVKPYYKKGIQARKGIEY